MPIERDSLLRGADRMAFEIIRLIDRGQLDSRSPAGDAMLDYVEDRHPKDAIATARFVGTPERGYIEKTSTENSGAGESGGLLNLSGP